jgi:hypothetical protein
MSEYNFQQFSRDMAQAAQLSAANEAAKNSARLLEAQKQQAAIEQQKLQLDQIRLQEERARHEAAQNKLERHKAIRNAMAEMERILQSFARDLAAGRLNQIIGGLPLISFLGALTRRQLQMVTACKDELEDLSDIRFMGALQQSFADLVSAHSGELSKVAIDKAFRKLNELAKWAESIEGKHVVLKKRTADLLKSLRSSLTDQNTLQKIESKLVQVEEDRQETGEVEAAMRRLWAGVELDIQKLEAAGFGVAEMELLTDVKAILSFPDFQAELAEIRTRLDESKETLQRSEIQWRRDDSLAKQGLKEIGAGNWGDAERTQGQIVWKDWADFDTGQVENALRAELNRLKEEISRLKSAKERVSLAAAHLQTYSASPLISDSLKKLYDTEIAELTARSRETRNAVVALAVVGVLGIGCYAVSKITAEKEKVAAAEHAEKERIAAAEQLEKERIAAAEAKMRNAKALAEGKLLMDEAGRSLLLVPEGSFQMGSDEISDEKPVRQVSVAAFFMGETEVTVGEWVSVLGWAKANGYAFLNEGSGTSDKHPVTNVSWYDTVIWCNAKSEKEGLTPCYRDMSGI